MSDNVWAEDPACYLDDAEIGVAGPPDGAAGSAWSAAKAPPAQSLPTIPVRGADV
jgi:hypothetical protein